MDRSTFLKNVEKKLDELDPFWKAFEEESDRAVAIVAVCLLDQLLERLIRASYIKDQKVNILFKGDHILQSFFAKINIAYFSGLIPDAVYHDLKLIGKIRNKFAHAFIGDLNFSDSSVFQQMNEFVFGPKKIPELAHPKIKFVSAVSGIVGTLQVLEEVLSVSRPKHLVDVFDLNATEWLLTQTEIRDIYITPSKG